MKLILFILLLIISLNKHHDTQNQIFNLNTFTKVPDDLMGCGDDLYLSRQDQTHGKLICRTDYVNALIYIDKKPVLLKADNQLSTKQKRVYTNGNYTLIIKMDNLKSTGDEDYIIIKSSLIIEYNKKIIYVKSVIGGGGC